MIQQKFLNHENSKWLSCYGDRSQSKTDAVHVMFVFGAQSVQKSARA